MANGADVFYVDHHFAGDIPHNKNLKTLINTTPDVCTSLLVNQYLHGAFLEWAIVGTFGDNLKKALWAYVNHLIFPMPNSIG
ncbi:MAG: hypothetical protein HC767_14795, partial [Akkermansiaceae bacterium]|nr:hypothetical protein [Akkermansiaceae bacterium]